MKRNSYRDLERQVVDSFFNRLDEQLFIGFKIAGTDLRRVIKKRIGGSGGYRVYLYAYVTEKRVYLGYIYPKTGPDGKVSLNEDFEAMIVREMKASIQMSELYEITIRQGKLHFQKS